MQAEIKRLMALLKATGDEQKNKVKKFEIQYLTLIKALNNSQNDLKALRKKYEANFKAMQPHMLAWKKE